MSQAVCSKDSRSTRSCASASSTPRMNERLEAIIPSMDSISSSIFCFSDPARSVSTRSRSRVNGVRRSWLIAASINVRSVKKRCNRSCMLLNARITRCSCAGPCSASCGALMSIPTCSAAPATRVNGTLTINVSHTHRPAVAKTKNTPRPTCAAKPSGCSRPIEVITSSAPPPRSATRTRVASGDPQSSAPKDHSGSCAAWPRSGRAAGRISNLRLVDYLPTLWRRS